MKKRITLITALALVFLSATAGWAQEDNPLEKTLSPYFFVENGESSADHFPLKSTTVQVNISGVIADVTVRQQYANEGAQPVSAKYIFPASTRAAVHGMKMIIGERMITAVVKEKQEARQVYEAAKREGKSASLLEQHRPNVFSMSVANIMPGDTVAVELSYTELLVPTDGTYEFVYPTVVGPRYSDTPADGAPASEQWVQNPYLKQGSEPETEFDIAVSLSTGMALQEAVCPSHETEIDYRNESTAGIRLADTGDFGGNRDFILRYRLAGEEIASGLMLYEGEKENFFLMMVQPPERVTPASIPDREYIFVVDVSGSMNGFPLNTAKELLKDLIGNLRATDTFNVLLFAGGSKVMSPASVPATQANLSNAIRLIDGEQGGGGTQLLKAMNRALALPRKEGSSRTMVVVTDGYISAERAVFESIQENLNRTNVFAFGIGSSVNRFLIEGMAKAGLGEPFVVTGPAEAPSVARKFREYISSPVLTEIEVAFNGFETYEIEPPSVPDLFAKRPVIVFGKWRGERNGTITVSGTSGDGAYRQTFNVSETEPTEINRPLRYLWARTRIARLSDFNTDPGEPDTRAGIVSLGLTYNLLTDFTSFVAVDDVIRNPGGESQDVKQPLPLPENVSNLAVSGPVMPVPEPELTLMLAVLFLIILAAYIRRRKE